MLKRKDCRFLTDSLFAIFVNIYLHNLHENIFFIIVTIKTPGVDSSTPGDNLFNLII